jgi:hypothetical protein
VIEADLEYICRGLKLEFAEMGERLLIAGGADSWVTTCECIGAACAGPPHTHTCFRDSRVSLCVPNLNVAPLLTRALETIFRQTLQDWELFA